MPTPQGPSTANKPNLPGAASANKDDKQPADILSDPTMTPGDKLKTLGALFGSPAQAASAAQASTPAGATTAQGSGRTQYTNPGQSSAKNLAGGPDIKAPGEKAFSLKTQHDPKGEVHMYAKNPMDAKTKYQKLGNPMGNLVDAEEVTEDGWDHKFYRDGSSMRRFKDYRNTGFKKDNPVEPQGPNNPYGAYTPGWLNQQAQANRGKGVWSDTKDSGEKSKKDTKPADGKHTFIIISDKHKRGDIRIQAKNPYDAERKYMKLRPDDQILDIRQANVGETMTTTLKNIWLDGISMPQLHIQIITTAMPLVVTILAILAKRVLS